MMHISSNVNLIAIIQIADIAYSLKLINTHGIGEKSGENRGIHTKALVAQLLTNPGCCKKYQMNVIAMHYDPKP